MIADFPSNRTVRWKRRAGAGGFTLIETLAVVLVAVLLLGLIFPMIRRVMNAADSVVCIANMKELGLAVTNCASDQDGYFPAYADRYPGYGYQGDGYAWYVTLQNGGYIPVNYSRLICPAAAKKLNSTAMNYGLNIAFAVNYNEVSLLWPSYWRLVRFSQISAPANKVLLADSAVYQGAGIVTGPCYYLYPFYDGDGAPHPVHGNSTHVLWVDGHISTVAAPSPKDASSFYLSPAQGGFGSYAAEPNNWLP